MRSCKRLLLRNLWTTVVSSSIAIIMVSSDMLGFRRLLGLDTVESHALGGLLTTGLRFTKDNGVAVLRTLSQLLARDSSEIQRRRRSDLGQSVGGGTCKLGISIGLDTGDVEEIR